MRSATIFSWTVTLCLVLGCADGVREDRTIEWSSDGDEVGFQHGEQGVFVASGDGELLEKIFSPDDSVIATSTPMWSPTDKRLIFATASSIQDETPNRSSAAAISTLSNQDPTSETHLPGEIQYTCWLRGVTAEGQPPAEPKAIFTATCNHPGYVAANLAIRWHPDGERVLYVDRLPDGLHSLFSMHLDTGQVQRIFPHAATSMVFNGVANPTRWDCVVANANPDNAIDGVWVYEEQSDQWWHVDDSATSSEGQVETPLASLQSSRPAWTKDGKQFAFMSYQRSEASNVPGTTRLMLVDAETRMVTRLYESSTKLQDIQWHPTEPLLGIVVGETDARLHTIGLQGELSPPLSDEKIRQFAGWDSTGRYFAFVTPDHIPTHGHSEWAFLLRPVTEARDRVMIGMSGQSEAAKMVHSGMRITFPNWSMSDSKISLWGTFSPTHQSIWSMFLRAGLRPGDPAAIMDADTGELTWMAVNAHEKRQVGHYWMLKKDYPKAWQWYSDANALESQRDEQAPQEGRSRKTAESKSPPDSEGTVDATDVQPFNFQNNAAIFEYLCLLRLNRPDEAAKRLDQFRREAHLDTKQLFPDGEDMSSLSIAFDTITQDFYIGEVFVSLDLAEAGVTFFADSLDDRSTDEQRLSRALVWSQMLLLSDSRSAYAELVTDTIAPLLLKFDRQLSNLPPGEGISQAWQFMIQGIGGLSVLPILHSEFVRSLPEEIVAKTVEKLQALRGHAQTDVAKTAIDLALVAAFDVRGETGPKKAVIARIQGNPVALEFLGEEGIGAPRRWVQQFR